MSIEKLCVSSQRTAEDVATELTIAYMDKYSVDKEEVAEMYKLFYKTAIEAYNDEIGEL